MAARRSLLPTDFTRCGGKTRYGETPRTPAVVSGLISFPCFTLLQLLL